MEIPESLKQRIDGLLHTKERVIVAVDGRCGSGKSTFGKLLADEYRCALVHMDDFFLRVSQRTPERLATPGENVDHERFLEEILLPIRRGEAAVLRPFDHSVFAPRGEFPVPKTPLTVIEGTYSCHKALRDYYDLCIFVTTDSETQMKRITVREGADIAGQYRTRWIPLEELYFSTLDIPALFDFVIET